MDKVLHEICEDSAGLAGLIVAGEKGEHLRKKARSLSIPFMLLPEDFKHKYKQILV